MTNYYLVVYTFILLDILALGISGYQNKNLESAKDIFRRVLILDPENIYPTRYFDISNLDY
jgi:hypothetical protein